MKIIDLLNKIANGEEIPKKIKWKLLEEGYQTLIYNEEEQEYAFEVDKHQFYNFPLHHLNDEVEIIEDTPEEDKKIEKLKSYISCGWNGTCDDLLRIELFNDLQKIGNKINEIIDCINEMKLKNNE